MQSVLPLHITPMKPLRHLLFFSFFLLATIYGNAQNILLLENKMYKGKVDAFFNNAPKYYILQEGYTIVYQLRDQKKLRKAKVENILFPYYLIIKDKPFSLSRMQMLRFKQKGIWVKRLVGPVVVAGGAAIMGTGAFLGNIFVGGLIEGSTFVFAVTPLTFAGATLGIGIIILGADVLIKGVRLTYNSFRRMKLNPNDDQLYTIRVIDKSRYKRGEILEEERPSVSGAPQIPASEKDEEKLEKKWKKQGEKDQKKRQKEEKKRTKRLNKKSNKKR